MIKNEREYKISKSWVRKFEASLEAAKARKPKDKNDAERFRVRVDGIQSQLEELQEDLAAYEALKEGKTQTFVVHTLSELPEVLIKARVARGLTHKELGEKLGVSEKQVQRDEANEYATAGFHRLIGVAEVLGVKLEVKAELVTR
jgi:ribosome-binding protein aMBF1 (putative translation factor)